MKEAERNFIVKTLFSGCVSLAFSVIGYLLLGPLGALAVISQIWVFQRRLFRDLDTLLFQMERL